jgi:hypothetical protein
MKRLFVVMLAVAGLALARNAFAQDGGNPGASAAGKSVAATKLSGPETLWTVKLEDLRPKMRVRIRLNQGRPFVGTVARVSETTVELDLSTEASGLPGKVRFRKGDIAEVTELKSQSDEEKRRVVEERDKSIAQIKVEAATRLEKRQAGERKDEETAKTAQEDYRKALDVVVSRQKEDEMRKLLAEFPTGDWGEEKFRQIRENWILRDLRPTDKEIRFLSVFKDWKEARDTVAILDEREQEKSGDKLLLKFPPSEGWGQAKLSAIAEKEAKGETVTEKETEFKKVYEAWSKAVVRRAAEMPAGETPGKGEEEKPVPENEPVAPAKPVEEKSAGTVPEEGKAVPTEKPAEIVPDEEKAPGEVKPGAGEKAPTEEKQPPAVDKAPDEVKPGVGEKVPADEPQDPAAEKTLTDEKTPEATPAAGEKTPAEGKPTEVAG